MTLWWLCLYIIKTHCMSYLFVFKRSLLGVKICLSHAQIGLLLGSQKPWATPRWSPLGVKFKISDEHPRLFHMGVPPRDYCKLVWSQADFECQIANWKRCIIGARNVHEIENILILVCEAVIAKWVMKVAHFTYVWSSATLEEEKKNHSDVIWPIRIKQMAQEANQNAKKTCTQHKARKTRVHGSICFCSWLVKNSSVSSDWAEQIRQILFALISRNAQLIRFMKIYSHRNKLPASKLFPIKCWIIGNKWIITRSTTEVKFKCFGVEPTIKYRFSLLIYLFRLHAWQGS